MSTENNKTFQEAWRDLADAVTEATKQLADSFDDTATQIRLVTQCKMRRFHVSMEYGFHRGQRTLAEGVVFEDGSVVLHWMFRKSKSFYVSMKDYEAERHPDHVVKFVDAEKAE